MSYRYLFKIETGEVFGWSDIWAKYPGFVEYDPEKHGYRPELAHVIGPDKKAASKPEAGKKGAKQAEPPASQKDTDDPFAGVE